MNQEDMKNRIRKTISLGLAISIPENDDFTRSEHPEWDSLKHVEIIFLLEDEFGIQFEEEDFSKLDSVNHIYSLVVKYLEA